MAAGSEVGTRRLWARSKRTVVLSIDWSGRLYLIGKVALPFSTVSPSRGERLEPHPTGSRMRYDLEFSAPLVYWPDLLAGAATTFALSVSATVLGFGLGVGCALARTGPSRAVAR